MAATAEPISNEQQASLAEPTSMEAIPEQKDTSIAPVEPSLTELREMFVDIKINIYNILRENEAMKNNMDELKAAIRGQNVKIANLRAWLNKAMKQFDDAERDLTETRKIEEVVLKLANALDVPVNAQDIEISHKLERKGAKPSFIIVKFVSH